MELPAIFHCQFFPVLWPHIPTDVSECTVRFWGLKLSVPQALMAFSICPVFICCPRESDQNPFLETNLKPACCMCWLTLLLSPAGPFRLGIALTADRDWEPVGQEPAMACRDSCWSAMHLDNFVNTSVSHSRTVLSL